MRPSQVGFGGSINSNSFETCWWIGEVALISSLLLQKPILSHLEVGLSHFSINLFYICAIASLCMWYIIDLGMRSELIIAYYIK